MEDLFKTCEDRLLRNGLADSGNALCGMADETISWNRHDDACALLKPLFSNLHVKSLVFARPAQPYRAIIDSLAEISSGIIRPKDSETRHFLKDLPVAETFSTDAIGLLLKHRTHVVIPQYGIVTIGAKTMDQAFVAFSSVCFACFVKFFSDFLKDAKSGKITRKQRKTFETIVDSLDSPAAFGGTLAKSPFASEDEMAAAICEAGRKIVELRLVDSNFGNISYNYKDMLFISRTGCFLDSLEGNIVACSLDESSPAPAKASSELPAHLRIIRNTGCRAVLHGHPKFSVILSMDCDLDACTHKEECHLRCPQSREVCAIPVVPGEVGGGPFGLCHTVPAAIKKSSGVIVHGHGVFTIDQTDFNGALKRLVDIENQCRIEYFKRVKEFT
jgi:ribulose-5-phosphate 4-epimerase/fuculose-1-phosphate aldolase